MASHKTLHPLTLLVLIAFCLPGILLSQQNPITTETAWILNPGTAYAEIGFGRYYDQPYPLSGLTGDLTKFGIVRFGFSFDGNVELQFDGTLLDLLSVKRRDPAFNSSIASSNSLTGDIGDFTLWTKIRFISEYRFFSAISLRFGVQLPNASNESGLGIDEFDFYSSLLFEKHISGVRITLNTGLGILGDPATLSEQHDTFLYALGVYFPVSDVSTLVAETAGRTGHHGIGVYRLANAKGGIQTSWLGLNWKLLGVKSFAASDGSQGAEISAGYSFTIVPQ